MYKKSKPEQHFTVTSAKRVAVFLASLKVVREKLVSNSLTVTTNVQHPKDQNVYMKESTVHKNDTLTYG